MALYIAGSLSFDRIMTFPGLFEEQILPEKLHLLNVCFIIQHLTQQRGGTAGNIAYTLALLGQKPIIVASVGNDFMEYAAVLQEMGLSLEGISRVPDMLTAGAYIITDRAGNQITGFYPGAMTVPSTYDFPQADPVTDIALIGPTCFDDMCRLPGVFRDRGISYVFDPGQQVPLFSGNQLINGICGSKVFITNEYELEMTCQSTEKTVEELVSMTGWLITTLGDQGSVVRCRDGVERIGIAKPVREADPTGCGDAYRSGLLVGMLAGLDMGTCARLGAVSASYCVEQAGPQEHVFTMQEFARRYEASFGPMPQL